MSKIRKTVSTCELFSIFFTFCKITSKFTLLGKSLK